MSLNFQYTEAPCPVAISKLMMRCRVRDPNQQPLIQDLANDVTSFVEMTCGMPIIQTACVWTAFREPGDIAKDYFDAWLQSGFTFGGGRNTSNIWIELPSRAVSIEQVSVGIWGQDDIVLTEGLDYSADLVPSPARIQLSMNDLMREFYNNYSHMQVNFTCGLYADANSIPGYMQTAICVLTKKLFDENISLMGNEELLTPALLSLLNEGRRWPIAG